VASTSRTTPWRDGDRKRAEAHAGKILAMLVTAGNIGCTNSQLWTVCHPVNSRISGLRKRGHKIDAQSEGGGVWRYRLIPPEPHHPSAFERTQRRDVEREAPLFASSGGR
jgi:hypothetical protein